MSSLVQEFIGAAQLVQRYGLKIFIETGVEDGVSLDVARNMGLALYTCDVDAAKVEMCRRAFPQAQISHALSLDHLRDVLPRIREPALIWLDAHFHPLAGDQQWPLYEELRLISTIFPARDRSVILADDYSCVLSKSLTDFDPAANNGDPRFCTYSHAELCNLLPYHTCAVLAENTGVAVWTPRFRTAGSERLTSEGLP